MPNADRVSLVIASYNTRKMLELTLAACARQSHRDFEVIVADDGSQENYTPLLQRAASWFAHGIQHVKHEDQGFRKTRILNRAVHVSRFDSLVFIDNDCLPHRH